MNEQSADRDVSLAEDELLAVLAELGVSARRIDPAAQEGNIELAGGGRIEVKFQRYPTGGLPPTLRRDGDEDIRKGLVPVLVAERLDRKLRDVLRDTGWGWLDRTGHLRLQAGFVHIDREIEPLTTPTVARSSNALDTPSGLAVATDVLRHGSDTVRMHAQRSGVSTGAAHEALTGLEAAGLRSELARSELFWAVAARWRPAWIGLSSRPNPGPGEATQRLLSMGWDDPRASGWAEVGDMAAQSYGVRIVGQTPPMLHVPHDRALTWAVRTWGRARDDQEAVTFVALPPVFAATVERRDVPHVNNNEGWLLADPLFVALRLAGDPDPRCREALDGWTPTGIGLDRVW